MIERVQGPNPWYGLLLRKRLDGKKCVRVIKARDEELIELARMEFDWDIDRKFFLSIVCKAEGLRRM